MAKLILAKGGTVLRELTLMEGRITIGRHPANDVVIGAPTVSSQHALIAIAGNDMLIEDLNSTNGTRVNGQPVRRHFLRDGDVISLAEYQLTFSE